MCVYVCVLKVKGKLWKNYTQGSVQYTTPCQYIEHAYMLHATSTNLGHKVTQTYHYLRLLSFHFRIPPHRVPTSSELCLVQGSFSLNNANKAKVSGMKNIIRTI